MIEYTFDHMPEKLRNFLEEAGACVFEERFDGKTFYVIYADDNIDDLISAFGAVFSVKNVDDTGWESKWKEFISEGWLTPSVYYTFEPKIFPDGRKTVFINPALAFGTGAHPTTRIAASLLESVCSGRTVLDVGTGSGILSVTASLCGAKKVYAFDSDDSALPNCMENARNNGARNLYAWAGEAASVMPGTKFDVVCANIISGVLLNLRDFIADTADKYIIYSGILLSEYENVIERLTPSGWHTEEKTSEGEWCGARLINDSRNR